MAPDKACLYMYIKKKYKIAFGLRHIVHFDYINSKYKFLCLYTYTYTQFGIYIYFSFLHHLTIILCLDHQYPCYFLFCGLPSYSRSPFIVPLRFWFRLCAISPTSSRRHFRVGFHCEGIRERVKPDRNNNFEFG